MLGVTIKWMGWITAGARSKLDKKNEGCEMPWTFHASRVLDVLLGHLIVEEHATFKQNTHPTVPRSFQLQQPKRFTVKCISILATLAAVKRS